MQATTTPTVPRRHARRRAVTVAFAAGLVLVLTACQNPIHPDNRPTIPAGQTNGALSTDLLVTVFGCSIHRDAVKSLAAMTAKAREQGVVVYAQSCYRDYASQVKAREDWCAKDACHMAAVPGTSNHGWGKAIDISSNTPMTFESPAYKWMKANAYIFGWNHPGWAEPGGSAPEPWHWEWVGDGGTMFPGTSWGPR